MGTMRQCARKLVLLEWMLLFGAALSATTPPTDCGSITDISEILWASDTSRLTVGDVATVFPQLMELTDASIADAISQADPDSLPGIIINRQAYGGPTSNRTKLFQYVSGRIPYDYQKLYDLYNYFTPEASGDETITESKFVPIQEFVLSTYETVVMQKVRDYLSCRGLYDSTFDDSFNFVYSHWFSSNAFENVFVGEYSLDNKNVLGLHNWYRFYWQERAGLVDLLGDIEVVEPDILAFPFCWNGRYQPQGSLFVGTSPDFEMALYMLCFLEMPGQECNVSLGGHPVTIKTEITDYMDPHIGSAYPAVAVPEPSVMCTELRPTTSPPPTTPQPDCGSLHDISEILWADDTSRVTFGDAQTLFPDMTEWTDSSIAQAISQTDRNSLPDIILNYRNNQSRLFQNVDTSKLNTETYLRLQTLMGMYDPQPFTDDWSTNERYLHINEFLDAVLATKLMKNLTAYLICKGFVKDETELLRMLETIWFQGYYRYSEAGGLDSSGFENTFLGEFGFSNPEVSGLHNWYRLYSLEENGNADYTGYLGGILPNVEGFSFDWANQHQPLSTMWMGSSPEFEMGIYTLCYFESPDYGCDVSLGGHLVTVNVDIWVYYDSQIKSAYPDLKAPRQITTTSKPSTTTDITTPFVTPTPVTTTTSTTTSTETSTNKLISTTISTTATSTSATVPGCGSLADISEILWAADTNRLTFGDVRTLFPSLTEFTDASIAEAISQSNQNILPDIIINLQAFSDNTKLFQYISGRIPYDYQKLYDLYYFFTPEASGDETDTESRFVAIQEFVLSTSSAVVMQKVRDYLSCRGLYDSPFEDSFTFIYSHWFTTYQRYPESSSIYNSNAFENVFVGEYSLDNKNVLGLHNWYRFYWQERAGLVDLLGDMELVEPDILAFPFCWNGRYQPQGSLFVGTSPDFEMALYMLCFLEMPGQECNVSLGGHPVTIKTDVIDYNDPMIGSAYPAVAVPEPSVTCNELKPTTSPPPTTTQPDCGSLHDISEILWADDTSRLTFGDAQTLFPDMTEWTDSSIAQAISQTDRNSLPDIILNYRNNQSRLFQNVDTSKLNTETYLRLQTLMGMYDPQPFTDDWSTNERYQHINEFLDAVLATKLMKNLTAYLTCKGFVKDETDLFRVLETIWFQGYYRYSEGGGLDSSGFENTFLGEFGFSDPEVSGLHNWYRLYSLEENDNADYTGYVGGIFPNIEGFSFDWAHNHQPLSTMWMGSSPEFEMGIYTLCYFESPDYGCDVSLGGHLVTVNVNIWVYYDSQIKSAYPDLKAPTQTTTTSKPSTTMDKTEPSVTPTPVITTTSTTTATETFTNEPFSSTMSTNATVPGCGSLTDISEILWTADTNRLTFGDVRKLFPDLTEFTDASIVGAISQANQSSLPDIIVNFNAASDNTKLFLHVMGPHYNVMPEYYWKLDQMYNNFTHDTMDYQSTTFRDFLSMVSNTEVMRQLQRYLQCQGLYNPNWDDWEDTIFSLWFDPYQRYLDVDLWLDSSGFENTFVGDSSVDQKNVSGLHNWYRFYTQDREGQMRFPGTIKIVEPNILTFPFCWSDRYQPEGLMWLGSGLDFEMALYTLCFLEMPGLECNVSLAGQPITVMTETSDYRRIQSAYPVVEVPLPYKTCADPTPTTTSVRPVTESTVVKPTATSTRPVTETTVSDRPLTQRPTTEGCPRYLYGPYCTEPCSINCVDSTCNDISGDCTYGCYAGYVGARCDSYGNHAQRLQVAGETALILLSLFLTTVLARFNPLI